MDKYDFSGWATRNDLLCSDGVVIKQGAFADCDGKIVPLVWNHQHNNVNNILGHALLKNMPEGTYAYCSFNDTESGKSAKTLVEHGDVEALSICANAIKKKGNEVIHGIIREVSLVLAGANPGAFIDSVIKHGEISEDEAVIYNDQKEISLYHADSSEEEKKEDTETADEKKENTKKADDSSETIEDVINSLTEKQKNVVYALIGNAIEDTESDKSEEDKKDTSSDTKVAHATDMDNKSEETENPNEEGGDEIMKHNAFENAGAQEDTKKKDYLEHAEEIITDAKKRYGSMKESALQHGITNIEYLFPDYKNVTKTPQFIARPNGWVADVMGSVHHTPFSRIKTVFADITEDEARAKGYIKGKQKKDEVFTLLKRTTDPQTVYKKQKLDRDDVIDITDFDVVAWMKTEMRWMLDEELARAFLVGDGRLSSSDDKIKEDHIRPIWTDDDLYTIKGVFTVAAQATADDKAKAFIRTAIKARKNYQGSGNLVLYCSEDVLTDCLLLTDEMGRDLYEDESKLAKKLRVSKIVTVPVMDGLTREVAEKTRTLYGIFVNLADYNVGADKGGAVNMFDDFDIDYNAQKYLIETRCSGALIKPYSAIAVELETTP